MRLDRAASEDEMIAEFLRQEYASVERYRSDIWTCLEAEGADDRLLVEIDLDDVYASEVRRRILGCYRGYGTGRQSFFTDFPTSGVTWSWVCLTPTELLDTRYIRYTYWTNLSEGTRSPRHAAAVIKAAAESSERDGEVPWKTFHDLANALRIGHTMPPLILVSADGGATRVVLEGHTRLTAFAMVPETIPTETRALLGTSPEISRWDEY